MFFQNDDIYYEFVFNECELLCYQISDQNYTKDF